jgi:hypothetical protein
MCRVMVLLRSSILASQRHHQFGGLQAAERQEAAAKITTCGQTDRSSAERCSGSERLERSQKQHHCALVPKKQETAMTATCRQAHRSSAEEIARLIGTGLILTSNKGCTLVPQNTMSRDRIEAAEP